MEQIPDKRVFLEEAIKIGDKIVDTAVKNEMGWYWTVTDHDGMVKSPVILYNGSSGIILYLIELYKATNKPEYYEAIVQASEWLKNYYYGPAEKNLAFYCGGGGIIYTLMEVYKLTGNQLYKHHALQFASDFGTGNHNSDILYGSAATILTLLHLHNETNEQWILDLLNQKISSLLNEAIVTRKGICWERNGSSVHPICGFAHGGSGIAFVFLELYKYFRNDFFLKIAEMAFEYEDQYFEENGTTLFSQNNWPDLRKSVYEEKGLKALIHSYKTNDIDEFSKFSFMSAWCHGAPGIGMARLHAYNLTGKKEHLNTFNKATVNTHNSFSVKGTNFCLCHGVLGNAHLLLDGFIGTGDESMYNVAVREGFRAIAEEKQQGYFVSGISKTGEKADCDLLNGIAGIGHYYIRLLNPAGISSILLPTIREVKTIVSNVGLFNEHYLVNFIFRKTFPNTSMIYIPVEKLIDGNCSLSRDEIYQIAKTEVNLKNEPNLNAAFGLDALAMTMADNIESDNYLFIQDMVEREKFNEDKFNNQSLQQMFDYELLLSPTITLQMVNYKFYTAYIVLQISPTHEPVNQFTISKLTYDILEGFKGCKNIGTVYEEVNNLHINDNLGNFDLMFKTQLGNALKLGFLTCLTAF